MQWGWPDSARCGNPHAGARNILRGEGKRRRRADARRKNFQYNPTPIQRSPEQIRVKYRDRLLGMPRAVNRKKRSHKWISCRRPGVVAGRAATVDTPEMKEAKLKQVTRLGALGAVVFLALPAISTAAEMRGVTATEIKI